MAACFLGIPNVTGTITALEIQKHDKDRVSVYLDGEFAFGLPVVDAARLHTGQVLSEQEIAALRRRIVAGVEKATGGKLRS